MPHIEHRLGPEELKPGSVFELRSGGRVLKVTVPEGARYGSTLRVGGLTVVLRPRPTPKVCRWEEVREVLLAATATEEMVELLVDSTRSKQEVAGGCRVRPPAGDESDDPDHTWVIEGFELLARGSKDRVRIPDAGDSPLDFHTHPGLLGSFAGFSRQDTHQVVSRSRPMVVVGYTVLAPELLTTLAFPLGSVGVATALGMQALLRLEASRRDTEPRLLKLGAAARVYFPDERMLPVRFAESPAWRRAVESAAFELDRMAMKASHVLEDAKDKLVGELMRRLRERQEPRG